RLLGLEIDIFGFPGVVLAQTLAFLPLAYLMIQNMLSSLDPGLEDSASNLGASEATILRTVVLPMLVPALLTGMLIVYVMAVAEFGNVAILAGRTPFLAPDIYTIVTGVETNFHMAGTLSVFLLLPVAAIFLVQNYFYRDKGYITISGKPTYSEPRPIGPALLLPMLLVAFVACGLILLSFAVVGVGAFTKIVGINNRSEERRVGKEWSVWSTLYCVE